MESPAGLIVGIGVAAFVAAWLLTPWLRQAAIRFRVVDLPSDRSSHDVATPRGGGLVIVLVALAIVAVTDLGSTVVPTLPLLAAMSLLVAVGLLDDCFGVTVPLRLAVQLLAATLVLASYGYFESVPLPRPMDVPLGWLAAPLTLLWLMAVANFYNFMDGIDGLAAAQGVVTGLAIAIANWHPASTVLAAAIAGGCCGFLKHNWSPARIFMGDVGSVPLGFSFAAMPLLAPAQSKSSVLLLVILSLWLFLADATFTLVGRVLRGEPWYEAHRTHLYQRLVDRGMSHARTTLLLGLGAAALSGLGLMAYWTRAGSWVLASLGLACALFVVEWQVASGRFLRRAVA